MKIKKVHRVIGKSIIFRNATVHDAEFIHSLRVDARKSRHLSKVDDDVRAQIRWLERYACDDTEVYFIITSLENEPLGTVRIYGAVGDSFCWGSWILVSDAPQHAAIESALMVYEYAVSVLGFKNAYFHVHRENQSVWKFHERFGAVRVGEDEIQYQYSLSGAAIASSMVRFKRYLTNGIHIQEISN